MTTNNETPDTGTPPAEVEALIGRLEMLRSNLANVTVMIGKPVQLDPSRDLTGIELASLIITSEGGIEDAATFLRTLTARIAELEGALEYEQAVANPYDLECYDGEWWVTAKTNNGFGPFDTEEEAQAKADEVNAPFREKFQQQLAAAAKAERAKCDEEYRERIDEARDTVLNVRHALAEGPLEGDPDTVNAILDIIDSIYPPDVADYTEAKGREQG